MVHCRAAPPAISAVDDAALCDGLAREHALADGPATGGPEEVFRESTTVPRLPQFQPYIKKNPGASVLKLALRALGDPGARCRTGSPACAARWGPRQVRMCGLAGQAGAGPAWVGLAEAGVFARGHALGAMVPTLTGASLSRDTPWHLSCTAGIHSIGWARLSGRCI